MRQEQINLTCKSDAVLIDTLILNGELFDPAESVNIVANLVSTLGVKTQLYTEVVNSKLIIELDWVNGRLPGCYDLEVSGVRDGRKWSTYADNIIRYTKATTAGGAQTVEVESDTYDITQVVSYRYVHLGGVDEVLVNGNSVVENHIAEIFINVDDVKVNGSSVINEHGVANITMPTKVSDLQNDSQFATTSQVALKEDIDKLDNTDGMAKIVIKANASFASQLTQTNTIYVIRNNFDLDGDEVTIPAGCVLQFEGGSLDNGTLIGNNTLCVNRTVSNFTVTFQNKYEDSEKVIIDGAYNGTSGEVTFQNKQILFNNAEIYNIKCVNCKITGSCIVIREAGLILGDKCELINARVKNDTLVSINQLHTGVLVVGDNVKISNCQFDSFYKGIQCAGRVTVIESCWFNEPTQFELEHGSDFYTSNIKISKVDPASTSEPCPRNITINSCKFGTCTDNCIDYFTGGREISINNCLFDNDTKTYIEIKSDSLQNRSEGFNTTDDYDKIITIFNCSFKKNIDDTVTAINAFPNNLSENENIRCDQIRIDSCELIGCRITFNKMMRVKVENSYFDFSDYSGNYFMNIADGKDITISNCNIVGGRLEVRDSDVCICGCTFGGYSNEATSAIDCKKLNSTENYLYIIGDKFNARITNLTGYSNKLYITDCDVNTTTHIINGDGTYNHQLYLSKNRFKTTNYLCEKIKGYFFFRDNVMDVNSYARVYADSFFDCRGDIIAKNATIVRCSPTDNSHFINGVIEFLKASGVSVTNAQNLSANSAIIFNNSENIKNGATSLRPSSPNIGYFFFDVTLGKPIWYNGTAWVDSTGTTV